MSVDVNVHGRPDAPHVEFKFIDGTEVSGCHVLKKVFAFNKLNKLTLAFHELSRALLLCNRNVCPQQAFDTQESTAHEILFQVHLKTMEMDAEYEMAGKSIDDEK